MKDLGRGFYFYKEKFKSAVLVHLTDEAHKDLKHWAVDRGTSLQKLVRFILEMALKDKAVRRMIEKALEDYKEGA